MESVGGDPDEGLRLVVVDLHELLDLGDQVGTEAKLPRRRALSVSSQNQRSTRFSQDDEVG